MMRTSAIAALSLIWVLLIAPLAVAQTAEDISFYVDGQLKQEIKPVLVDNMTYLPVIDAIQYLDAVFIASKTPGRFAIRKGALYTQMTVNESRIVVNSKEVPINYPPVEIKQVIYLPLPLLLQCTAFNGSAEQNIAGRQVNLYTPRFKRQDELAEGSLAVVSPEQRPSTRPDQIVKAAALDKSQYIFGEPVRLKVYLGKFTANSTVKTQLWYTTNIMTGVFDEGGIMQLHRTKVEYLQPSMSGNLVTFSFMPSKPGNYTIHLHSRDHANFLSYNFSVNYPPPDYKIVEMIISDSGALKGTDADRPFNDPYVFKSGSNVYCHLRFDKPATRWSMIKVTWARYYGGSQGRIVYFQQIFFGDGTSRQVAYPLKQAKSLISLDQHLLGKPSEMDGTWLVEVQLGKLASSEVIRQFKIGSSAFPTVGRPDDI